MTLDKLRRVRWGVRAALALGVAASVTANVLHAQDNPISQSIAAWPPIALLITVDLISRVPVHSRRLAVARILATAVIAGIAAWVSYWHMVGVALRYGETADAAHMMPLSVDGLVVVASICLVELSGRIREAEADPPVTPPAIRPAFGPVFDYDHPAGPEVDNLTLTDPLRLKARKPHPSARDRVIKAHERKPDATNAELAKGLNLSLATVKNYRPKRTPETAKVNGRKPQLEGANN